MRAFHLWPDVNGKSPLPLTFGIQRKKAPSLIHTMEKQISLLISAETVALFSCHRGKMLTAGSAALSKCTLGALEHPRQGQDRAGFLPWRSGREGAGSLMHYSLSLCRELERLCH